MTHTFRGERTLMRIFIGESDRCRGGPYQGKRLSEALLRTFRDRGFAGTTLLRGVNVVGSFLLGFLTRTMEIAPVSPEVRTLSTVGFCGAFTTFSTFSYETVILMQEGAWSRAALYAFGSLALSLLALFGGITLATGAIRPGG